jgi:hypothetical protein
LTITTSTSTPIGIYVITVQGTSGTVTRATQFTLIVSSFDFSLTNTGGITLTQGRSGSTVVKATLAGGVQGSVGLQCSGLPSGGACSFSPASGTPTFSSTLTISTQSSTPVGNFTITVTGIGGGVTHTTQFILTVSSSAGSVGGTEVPVDKLGLLAPYIGLASIILGLAAVAILYTKRVRLARKDE